MASPIGVELVAKMAERESREERMRKLLACIDQPGSRRLLAHLCMSWMEAHSECNELARAMCDSVESERGAA